MQEVDPSPFYAQFAGAQTYDLVYPFREPEGGPHWTETGALIHQEDERTEVEPIMAVPLGNGRYLFAERDGAFFSGLRLNWGDEFEADDSEEGILVLQRVVMPQHYEHLRCSSGSDLVPGRTTAFALPHFVSARLKFSNDHPIAQLVHELAGGWESMPGCTLTLSIPKAKMPIFWQEMQARALKLEVTVIEPNARSAHRRSQFDVRTLLAKLSR
jgi:hypothetical protein